MPNISEWPDQISKKKSHYFFCPSLILIKIKTEVLLSFCIEIKNPRECWFELCIYAFFFENVLEWKGNSVGNKREQRLTAETSMMTVQWGSLWPELFKQLEIVLHCLSCLNPCQNDIYCGSFCVRLGTRYYVKKLTICYNILLGTRNLAETKGKSEFTWEVVSSWDRGDGVGCMQNTWVVCRAPWVI